MNAIVLAVTTLDTNFNKGYTFILNDSEILSNIFNSPSNFSLIIFNNCDDFRLVHTPNFPVIWWNTITIRMSISSSGGNRSSGGSRSSDGDNSSIGSGSSSIGSSSGNSRNLES
jgi:hypothetical protein